MTSGLLRQYLSATGVGLVARVLGPICGFVNVYLLIRVLGAGGYGTYVTALTAYVMLGILFKTGLDKGITYRVPRLRERQENQEVRGFFTRAVGYVLIVSTIGFLMALVGTWGLGFYGLPQALTNWLYSLAGILPVLATKDLTTEYLVTTERVEQKYFLETILPKVIFLMFVLYFYWEDHSDPLWVATGLILSHLLPLSGWLIRELSPSAALSATGSIPWKYCFRMLVNDTLKFSLWRVDVLFVYGFLGGTVAGGYKIASRLARFSKLADELTTQVFRPRIGGYLEGNDRRSLSREYDLLRTLTLSYSLSYLVLIVFIGVPLLTFFGPYRGLYSLLLLLCAGYSVVVSFGNIGNLLVMEGRSGWVTGASAIGWLVNVGGNLVLIPFFGALGAALATVASVVVQNGVAVAGVRWTMDLHMVDSAELGLAGLGLCFALGLAVSGVSGIFWYCLAVLPVLHGWVRRDILANAWQKIVRMSSTDE